MRRILSGNRPTGKLHIGHLFGVLQNWKRLQYEYESFFEVADWHALTTNYKKTDELQQNIVDMVIDWLVVGIDPEKATIFVQSDVKEHAELHLLFSMIITVSRLLRNPTLKEYIKEVSPTELTTTKRKSFDKFAARVIDIFIDEFEGIERRENFIEWKSILKQKLKEVFLKEMKEHGLEEEEELTYGHLVSYGYLGYPVLQASDILVYRASHVPIGADQLPHLEITREIARRFNHLYGEVFPIPEPILTEFAKVPGIDGRKMSKSYGNTILISEDPETLKEKVMSSYTDPQKIRKNDPGHPEGCPIFAYHKIFHSESADEAEINCKKGLLGCVEHKKFVAEKMIEFLEPYRAKRSELEQDRNKVVEILKEGAQKARVEAEKTLELVREHMKLWG